MNEAAPQILLALEASGAGQAIRQSTWLYPTANTLHVVGLALFAGALAVMDLRMVGAFGATRPADVIMPARRIVIAGLGLMIATGLVLFTAEASHVALNTVFQIKMALVALAIANALLLGRMAPDDLARYKPHEPLPDRVRTAAKLSLALWLTVAALGRLIAYF
jgi:hypothetical protein